MAKKLRPKQEPYWLNLTNMARSLGVSRATFMSWGVKPVAELKCGNYFLVEDVLKNRIDHHIRKSKRSDGLSSDEANEAMAAAKLEEVTERAENLAIKNALLRKEVAPINILEQALGQICAQIAATLESIPVNVKRRNAKLEAMDIQIIKEEIVKCQNIAAQSSIDMDKLG